jgi:hypothetical protein
MKDANSLKEQTRSYKTLKMVLFRTKTKMNRDFNRRKWAKYSYEALACSTRHRYSPNAQMGKMSL